MPIQMSNGTNIRLVDEKGEHVVTNTPKEEGKVSGYKIEIDSNKNGVFGDQGDVTLSNENNVALLTDKKKGNIDGLIVPGVDESVLKSVDRHLALAWPVAEALKVAETRVSEINNTWGGRVLKRRRLGLEAIMSNRDAFQTDPGNTPAKIAYGITLIRTASEAPLLVQDKYMGFNDKGTSIAKESKAVIESLAKDKTNILSQLLARKMLEFYIEKSGESKWQSHLPNNPQQMNTTLSDIKQSLSSLKQSRPDEYETATDNINKWFKLGSK